jgi:hypothetical protein
MTGFFHNYALWICATFIQPQTGATVSLKLVHLFFVFPLSLGGSDPLLQYNQTIFKSDTCYCKTIIFKLSDLLTDHKYYAPSTVPVETSYIFKFSAVSVCL